MVGILREIYTDSTLGGQLGFKGGTAALLFYGLPRFSVDLDFDLLNYDNKELVFERIQKIVSKYGDVIEATDKRYTLFFLVSYQKRERNLKVEISKRPIKSKFVVKNYLGISMLVTDKEDMLASKLTALITRKKFANRDVFDLWYFLKNNWELKEELVKKKSGLTISQALDKAIDRIKNIKKTEILNGLGELVDEKQKVWVKEKLTNELIFLLELQK
ncbi:MAG: nucleotidyl transferase AbiEii/AbiGii toxin family protein [Patescibacteria group bacterium]